eukprot:1576933-Pyramimonas_sp.AAC.1
MAVDGKRRNPRGAETGTVQDVRMPRAPTGRCRSAAAVAKHEDRSAARWATPSPRSFGPSEALP